MCAPGIRSTVADRVNDDKASFLSPIISLPQQNISNAHQQRVHHAKRLISKLRPREASRVTRKLFSSSHEEQRVATAQWLANLECKMSMRQDIETMEFLGSALSMARVARHRGLFMRQGNTGSNMDRSPGISEARLVQRL